MHHKRTRQLTSTNEAADRPGHPRAPGEALLKARLPTSRNVMRRPAPRRPDPEVNPYSRRVHSTLPGLGTLINAAAVVGGSLLGMAVGNRLPERTRSVVTDCLGLVTLLLAALSAADVTDPAFADAVGSSAPVLIVMGSLLLGGICGSLLRIEDRLAQVADRVHLRMGRWGRQGPEGDQGGPAAARERFVEGWLTATLVFCVGPLTILGSLDDGLGRGIDLLAIKSVLDGFAAIAFAASFGIGVLMSAGSVLAIQGSLTIAGVLLGAVLPEAAISALTATGGLVLAGIGLRLLRITNVPVADLLPAIVIAPLLTALVSAVR